MVVWEGRWGLGWVSRGVKIRPPLPWTDRQTERQFGRHKGYTVE